MLANRIAGNYVWVSLQNRIVGAVSPYSIAPKREVDCYDLLSVAYTISGNSSLSTIGITVSWYDENNVFIFSESTDTLSTATGSDFTQFVVKGSYASLSVTGGADITFTISVTAVLVNQGR